MQRDMDLVRQILLTISEHPSAQAPRVLKIEGRSREEVVYHCALMIDADLLNGSIIDDRGVPVEPAINRLTWYGHEFLDAARDPTRWEQASTKIAKIGGASIPIWLEVLKYLAIAQLGL